MSRHQPLPIQQDSPSARAEHPFPDAFYPVVDSIARVDHLATLGARTIQLRIKNLSYTEACAAVKAGLEAAAPFGARLVINDYWQAAIDAGARYLHLGQEDLDGVDMQAIRRAEIVLGLSTHNEEELEIALSHAPDHVALGAIYPSSSKDARVVPHALDRLRAWKKRLGKMPLIAIGGITLERAPEVFAAGADSIAVIGDITAHPQAETRTHKWVETAEAMRLAAK